MSKVRLQTPYEYVTSSLFIFLRTVRSHNLLNIKLQVLSHGVVLLGCVYVCRLNKQNLVTERRAFLLRFADFTRTTKLIKTQTKESFSLINLRQF